MKKNHKILLITLGVIAICVVIYQLLFSPPKDFIIYEVKIVSISGENIANGDTLFLKNLKNSSVEHFMGDSISIKVKPLMVDLSENYGKTSPESTISGSVFYPYIIKGIIIKKVSYIEHLKYCGPYG